MGCVPHYGLMASHRTERAKTHALVKAAADLYAEVDKARARLGELLLQSDEATRRALTEGPNGAGTALAALTGKDPTTLYAARDRAAGRLNKRQEETPPAAPAAA